MEQEYRYINSIFESKEWLAHSFGDNFKEIFLQKGDIIQGRWGFGYTENKLGFKIISMPNGNQSCGPWLHEFGGKKYTRLGNEHKLLEGLIKKLPSYDVLKLSLDNSIVSAYPFYWNNINYTTRYTYILNTSKDIDEIELGFNNNIRKDLKNARKFLIVEESESLDVNCFIKIHRMVFERTGQSYPYSEEYMTMFTDFFSRNGMLKIITVKDNNNSIHTQILLIDDFKQIQYVFGATDTKYRGSGSSSLALFYGIELAKKGGKNFNFYGSMTRSIENYFRSFGADITPYYSIEDYSKKYKSYKKIKNIFK